MTESAGTFLTTFAVVLCTAAVTTVLFQRLRQPVVLGYLLAGLLIGPHVPGPLVADHATIETLAELGVILLLFSIGLEFSVRRLLRIGGGVAVTAIIDVSLMAWLGLGAARLLGWSTNESLFAAGIFAISSTTIIAKAFEEGGVERRLRELVFGVLIVEDLAAVLMLAGLATLGTRASSDTLPLMATGLRLVSLLLIWVTAGLLLIPRLMRSLVRMARPETTLIASIGLCFAFALLARALGYSTGLGAFIAGSLIAESGKGKRVAELVEPVRDVFGAVFFVAVGMLLDPALVLAHWGTILVLSAVVILGKIFSVSLGAFLAGQGTRLSVQAGMSMAQIGEFSFIIASLGVASGATRDFIYPIAVAVSAITVMFTPWLVKASPAVAAFVDRKLPRPLQAYASLYGTWLDALRDPRHRTSPEQRIRRKVQWLGVDALLLTVLVIGVAVMFEQAAGFFTRTLGLGQRGTAAAVIGAALLVAAPFAIGITRTARSLADQLARRALPAQGKLDLADAPRRALVVTLEIAILLSTGLPILLVTQPFLPPFRGAVVLVATLILLGIAAWRSARNLEGHMRAGAEVLLAAVQSTLPPEQATMEMAVPHTLEGTNDPFMTATHMLPGLGSPTAFHIDAGFDAIGKNLATLALRGRTGATVLGITREGAAIPAPSKVEQILEGDTLILVGGREAVEAAKRILVRGDAPDERGGGRH